MVGTNRLRQPGAWLLPLLLLVLLGRSSCEAAAGHQPASADHAEDHQKEPTGPPGGAASDAVTPTANPGEASYVPLGNVGHLPTLTTPAVNPAAATGATAQVPVVADGAPGVGATPSRRRRLAGTTPATVSAQLLTPLGFDLLQTGQVPATCDGGGACGNVNGNSNVQIVEPGVEFGWVAFFFGKYEEFQVDITARGIITVTYKFANNTYLPDHQWLLTSPVFCGVGSFSDDIADPKFNVTASYANNVTTILYTTVKDSGTVGIWRTTVTPVICPQFAVCPSPPAASHLNLSSCPSAPLKTGDSCSPACLPGYALQGTVNASCCFGQVSVTGNGTCVAQACSSKPVLANGDVSSCPTPFKTGDSCSPVCLPGYAPEGTLRASCNLGKLSVTGACIAQECTTNPPDILDGSWDCGSTAIGDSCTAKCSPGFDQAPSPNATCTAVAWSPVNNTATAWSAVNGTCQRPPTIPPIPSSELVYQTARLPLGLSTSGSCSKQAADALGNGLVNDLQQLLANAAVNDTSIAVLKASCSSNDEQCTAKRADQSKHATTVQHRGSVQQLILVLVQPLPKADFTSSNGTLLSGSAKVLQQLRQAIAAGGIMSSLPITADSFSRATGQALLGLEGPAATQLAAVNISTQDASSCSAGQEQYVPLPAVGPCYVCPPATYNPAPGATCKPCSIAFSEPIGPAGTGNTQCACAEGFQAVTINITTAQGALKVQQCVQQGLSCSSVPNSVVNIVGNGCACRFGYLERFDSSKQLIACDAAELQVTAQSSRRTNISLPSSSGGILAVSNSSNGGRVSVVKGSDGTDLVTYLSRFGFVGKETINVTTAQGVTTITVDVTPGSCTNNLCGLQRQSGSCEQGRCSCVPGSQMASTFARNPDAAARAVVPVVPACRYRNFTPTGRFSLAGMTASPGEALDITFTLAPPGAPSQCAGPDAALLPVVKLLRSTVGCSRRVAPAAQVQQISSTVAACEGGVYSAQVEVPAGSAGVCYVVRVALADGNAKRAALKVA